MLKGYNVMLTGPAGSGKSWLIQEFIKKSKKRKIAITATTGLAATHLNGQTIHSWSGIGLGTFLEEDYIYTISEMRKKQMRKTQTLIIDEISMMHDYNLDMVDNAMRLIRESNKPFGGLQVILCGDFFQLPPVMQGGNGKFVTESRAWKELDLKVCYLEEQHRAEDLRLQEILNAMRAGTLNNNHVNMLKTRMGHQALDNVTRLYTINADVEHVNMAKLNEVRGDSHYFLRTSTGRSYADLLKLQKNVLAPEILRIKQHAVVMAVKNSAEGEYANGSIGIVTDFTDDGFPIVDFGKRYPIVVYPDTWEYKKNDRVTATITQIPLRLAYAITVHKSQGMTLDAAEMDLSGAFVAGMGYVALSRVKNLDSLYLKGMNDIALQVSREAMMIDKMLIEESNKI